MGVLAAAIAIADLCRAAPTPGDHPDPADSAAYAAVGDDAAAAGDARTAAIAYRKAIALDGSNARANAALAALCKGTLDEGDALLDAIARYRAGDLGEAAAALSAIVAQSREQAAAHFFLGVIALDRHQARRAARELALARRDPAYRALADGLLRLARRDGRLAFTFVLESELDTNPQLLPDTPPAGATTGGPQLDEDVVAAATITARPWPWLAVRNAVTWRNQRALSALDFVSESAQVAAELVRGRDRVTLRYELDYDLLDGARYLFAHRAGVAIRHDGTAGALVASYALRHRDFASATQAEFTGWVHAGDAGAGLHLRDGLELDARLFAIRELTRGSAFSNATGGAELALRTRATAAVRLAGGASASLARYDAAQPDGRSRRDLALAGRAGLEVDLGDHLIAVAGLSATRNASTVEDFRYWKLVASCGLVLAFGAL